MYINKILCKLNIHKINKISKYIYRIDNKNFLMIDTCQICGKKIAIGILEFPLPTYLTNINFEEIEEY